MRLLARRDHSRYELTQKLRARFGREGNFDTILDTLEQDNLLSEARYIEQIIHSKQQRGYGPVYIRSYLREKGISGGKIEDCLHFDDEGWCAIAKTLHAKRFGEKPQNVKERAKQIRFMQSRGFTSEQINNTLS